MCNKNYKPDALKYDNGLVLQKTRRNEAREQLVSEGLVSEKELRADMFAVEYLGAQVVTSGLWQIKELMVNRYVGYESGNIDIITRELDWRIERIK